MTKPPVLILGAGLAGLTAAHILNSKGIDCLVIEGSARAGGRVESIKLPDGQYCEAGAESIGEDHRTIRRYCQQFKLELVPWATATDLYAYDEHYSHGDKDIQNALMSLHENGARLDRMTDEEQQRLTGMSAERFLRQLKLSGPGTAYIRLVGITDFGSELSNISAYTFLANYRDRCNNDDAASYRIVGGNSRLIDALTHAIGEQKVIYDRPVEAIHKDYGTFTVQCAGGNLFTTDKLICALPLSVYPQIDWNFTVPAAVSAAVQQIQFGTVAKTCYVLDTPLLKTFETISDLAVHHVYSIGPADMPGTAIVSYAAGNNAFGISSLGMQDILQQLKLTSVGAIKPGTNIIDTIRATGSWAAYNLAYSEIPAESEAEIYRIFSQPTDNLYWAGEHTGRMHGYMEGAMESGERAAHAIIDTDRKQ